MGFHHVAIATRDVEATHAFYTNAMGFELVKVDAIQTLDGTGWARHLFYDTHGQGLIAFWDLHDDTIGDFDPSISKGLGLPVWTNHLAFDAVDLDGIAEHRNRWLDHGYDVIEVDHGWCTSIYTTDPNGVMVEFCATTRAFTDADREQALRLLTATEKPELLPEPPSKGYEAAKEGAPA